MGMSPDRLFRTTRVMNRTVEILEGNETIRSIMARTLRRIGVDVVERADGEDEEESSLADLLVASVDSGVPGVDDRADVYLDDERAVVYCGLRDSREDYAEKRWIERPFTPQTFLAECADALGLAPGEMESTDGDVTPPEVSFSTDEKEPITRELGYDEAQELEKRLGLQEGTLGPPSEPTLSDEESFEVLDLDDSMVLEVDELQFTLGGRIVSEVESRRVDDAELEAAREDESRSRGVRSPTFSQTMPDTPTALGDADGLDVDDTRDRRLKTSDLSPIEPTGLGDAESSETSGAGFAPNISTTELRAQIRGVARMLAESWQRIALTSRTDDRADRIERILVAAVSKGMRGAAAEVQRIPSASGFAGALSTMTFVDTIRTIRDRRLRGRLEVAVGDEAYVLHMEGHYLQEIDALSGNVDGMLLDILHQGGAIDDRTYEELTEAFEAGHFMGPLELELARQQVVADATLQSARVVRAREIFRQLCGTRGGQFAFLEIRSGDGQPWPVDPLLINVDQLLLELLRESSIDTGDSRATARTRLVLDPNRAAALEPSRLTEEERNVMMFFKEGETLESARERLQKQAGPEEVDRIVDRLKKVELLKRSDPTIPVPKQVEERASSGPHETVVSDVTGVLDEDARLRAQDDKTTSLKPNWDVAPDAIDSDEVSRLVDDAIDKYERESEAEADAEASADGEEAETVDDDDAEDSVDE